MSTIAQINALTKQLLINKIDLPYDMLCIIKDYVFLDNVSYNNKCKKTIVINDIKNAIVSSLYNIYYPATEPEPMGAEVGVDSNGEEELIIHDFIAPDNIWAFYAIENETHFQAIFCLDCGNYVPNLNHNYNLLVELGLIDIQYSERSLCCCI